MVIYTQVMLLLKTPLITPILKCQQPMLSNSSDYCHIGIRAQLYFEYEHSFCEWMAVYQLLLQ